MPITNKDKIEVLKQGSKTEFWKIIVEALKDSREALVARQNGDELIDLPADQYKIESELLKAKIQYLNKLMKTPAAVIEWLQTPDNTGESFDPYE